jgi:hypothetical protein
MFLPCEMNEFPMCNRHECLFHEFAFCTHDVHYITPNSNGCLHLTKCLAVQGGKDIQYASSITVKVDKQNV